MIQGELLTWPESWPSPCNQGKRNPIMRRRPNLVLYILLNIIVSAATTLGVLVLWDNFRPPALTRAPQVQGEDVQPDVVLTSTEPAPTLPAADKTVIEISSVVAAGDVTQESVLLRRIGEGNLLMTGWKLSGEHNNTFVFPTQPELILYKGGAVEVLSRAGDNTATEVFWDRSEAAWQSGETLQLVDTAGNIRAEYKIP
jgi:hypothetical protein